MDPLSTGGLEVSQKSLVDGEEFGKERDGLEARLSILGSFAEDEERDWAEDNGAGDDTSSFSLVEFLNSLVEGQLEVSLIRELRDDEVVVGVKPMEIGLAIGNKITVRLVIADMNLPLLHLGSRNINTICLSATAHGEVNVKGRQTKSNISLGDDVECGRVIKDMIVQGEFTTGNFGQYLMSLIRSVAIRWHTWGQNQHHGPSR